MVETNFLKEYYSTEIYSLKDSIRFYEDEIAVLNRIRENYSHNLNIVELCREIIFYNAKNIKEESNEIDGLRNSIKELG
jgi:hypothetical protein